VKYAIVSDIHANLAAWNAVLLDIRSNGVDCIICLGDMLGYGPRPREVLESLYTSVDHFLLGNHDAAICGKIDPQCFNEPAREIIRWTAAQLGESAKKFLSRLPLCLAGENFRCAHANFDKPAGFHYVFEPQDAVAGWRKVQEPLLFIGHTHQPGIFVIGRSQTPRLIPPEDFMLEEGKRFLVNVGSVGQPRDGDYRASYCIFDEDTGSVFWHKVPFDLDAHRADMEKAGLPLEAAPFLDAAPQALQPPLRERVDFSPPTRLTINMHTTVPVQYLAQMKRRARMWRTLFLLMTIIIAVGIGVAGWQWWRFHQRRLTISGVKMEVVRGDDMAPGNNFLEFPSAPTTPNQPLHGWDLQLHNRYQQSIVWQSLPEDLPEDAAAFHFHSADARAECWLVSPSIHLKSGTKLKMQGLFKKSQDFRGSIALIVELTKTTDVTQTDPLRTEYEVIRHFIVKEPNVKRANDWWLAQQTFELPARNVHSVRLRIGGKFKGDVQVRGVRLESPL
jgi:predicted phosphodiesterase